MSRRVRSGGWMSCNVEQMPTLVEFAGTDFPRRPQDSNSVRAVSQASLAPGWLVGKVASGLGRCETDVLVGQFREKLRKCCASGVGSDFRRRKAGNIHVTLFWRKLFSLKKAVEFLGIPIFSRSGTWCPRCEMLDRSFPSKQVVDGGEARGGVLQPG